MTTLPARKRSDHALLWTVVGSVAGVGSLVVAVLFGDAGKRESPAQAQAPSPGAVASDSCLVGTWVSSPHWSAGDRFTLADGRSFAIDDITGELRYYFGGDGRGSIEQVENVTGKLDDGRAVWHKFVAKADFHYSTGLAGQIIYQSDKESASTFSQVVDEKVTKEVTSVTLTNDTYTCSEKDLILKNAEPAEYHLQRQ
jgi:hypothetical protein